MIADEMALGMVNQKTTAARLIPVIGKGVGDTVEFGGLFGYAGTNATIANVGIGSGEIGSQTLSFIGAIVGWSDGADIINCWNGADITCSGWSGGIVGTVRDGGESIIRGCYNIGNVTARDGAVGGIVGHLAAGGHGTDVSVTVSDCYNLGNVTAKDNAAGIAGRIQDGNTVVRCYNAGRISVNGENILDGAGAIVSLLTSGSTVSECYYDAAQCDKGISSGSGDTAAMSRESMCSGELLALLGAGFKADSYGLVNGGYPLTYWQPTDDADEIDNVNELISAIGEVTLDSADAIIAARNAYDNLEDELKAHVSGLEQLTAAEQALAALQTLRETKDTAIKELREYKAPEDYREIERAQLELIITEGNAAIETAADADAVRAALVDAKAKLDELKTDAVLNDEESAARVSDTIASIGDVTLDSGALIESIRAAYDSLSDTAKTLVNNYNVLTAAEDKLAELRRDEDNKPKPDDKPGGDTDNKPENKPSDTKPSTDGSTILPFKSSPFELAASGSFDIQPVLTVYRVPEGADTPCWFGDMELLPHLWHLVGIPYIDADVYILPKISAEGRSRKELAEATHEAIRAAHERIVLKKELPGHV